MMWERVPPRGIVYSFARNWHPFGTEMRGKTPFVSVLVELPQAGGARLLGRLSGADDGFSIGAPLTGFVEPFGPEKRPALLWRLAPAQRSPETP